MCETRKLYRKKIAAPAQFDHVKQCKEFYAATAAATS